MYIIVEIDRLLNIIEVKERLYIDSDINLKRSKFYNDNQIIEYLYGTYSFIDMLTFRPSLKTHYIKNGVKNNTLECLKGNILADTNVISTFSYYGKHIINLNNDIDTVKQYYNTVS